MNSVIARAIFVVILFVVSALFFWQSPPASPVQIAHLDKAVHFMLFFVLAASMHYAFRLPVWVSLPSLLVYGIAIEVIQHQLPTRTGDVWDVVADMVGAVTFFLLFALYKRLRRS